MHRFPVFVWSFVAGLAALPAQTKAGGDGAVRSAHAGLVAARAEVRELTGARGLPDPGQFGSVAEFRAHLEAEKKRKSSPEHRAMMAAAQEKVAANATAFVAAFRTSDWHAFDPAKDEALLRDGLSAVAEDSRFPHEVVAACRFFLDTYGGDPASRQLRVATLPMALLALGEAGEAIKVLERCFVERTADPVRSLVMRGDVFAASGDAAMARKTYEEAMTLAKDPGVLRPRLDLVGRPAPDIDSKAWLGSDAKPVSTLAGSVVVLDFWASHHEPCRATLLPLDALYRSHRKDGLAVLGITRRTEIGYLPASAEQILRGGAGVRGLTDATFAEHLATFRANTGITFPFVVATVRDHELYGSGPRRAAGVWMVVIGRDGTIALLVDQPGLEPLVKFAVENLLAAGRSPK